MSEQEPAEVGSAMWGGMNPFRRDLTVVPNAPRRERMVSASDAVSLVLLGVGTVLAPVGVAFAASPGWGLAVFGALCVTLGVLIGVGSSR